jgi:glutamate/tyrosine decarboxylase-like PLP-dependent enzyme
MRTARRVTITMTNTGEPADDALARRLADRALRLLESLGNREAKVIELAGPAALVDALPLSLGDPNPAPETVIADVVEQVIHYAARTDHPRFANQNFAGPDPIAVVADWIGAALNTTTATFEVAPVFTLMERALLGRMAELAGWGLRDLLDELPAGILCPGGSTANQYAMQLARRRADPAMLERGANGGPRLVAFTSRHAHYSVGKSARLLGVGADNVVEVECDETGAMVPAALQAAMRTAVEAGAVPFFVNATAATTVTGAFDPVDAIVEIAGQHDAWVHVDGAIGGSVLFSERERKRLAGVEHVHSLTWNLHKLGGITQQCSALLVRDPSALRATFSTRANYLFQPDKNNAHLDSGDLTFQCARRNDALKGWLTWKSRGERWLGARVERAVDLAQRLEGFVRADPRFTMVVPRTFTHVCFWWLPPDLRDAPNLRDPGVQARLHALAPRMKDAMQRSGQSLVGYQPVAGGPNAWRMLFINPAVGWDDVMHTMELIAALGDALQE